MKDAKFELSKLPASYHFAPSKKSLESSDSSKILL